MLGFSSDATVKLAAGQIESTPGILKLLNGFWIREQRKSEAFRERFAVCHYRVCSLLREFQSYSLEHAQTIDERNCERAEALAKLVLQPNISMYRVSLCVGWKCFIS